MQRRTTFDEYLPYDNNHCERFRAQKAIIVSLRAEGKSNDHTHSGVNTHSKLSFEAKVGQGYFSQESEMRALR